MPSRQEQLRIQMLELIRKWGSGHSGRALSSVDLLEALYFGEDAGRPLLNFDVNKPQLEERDRFVLSKLEALPALYTVLREVGYHLPELLPKLPDRHVPGVELSSQEPAFGLAAAVGMAKIMQMERSSSFVFCLAADYELKQGVAWEAIQYAAEERLDQLCLILDENTPQDLRIQDRFEAFGWRVIKLLDAHDHDDIAFAYSKARVRQRKPTCLWAPTLKSAGVTFAERKPEYDDVVFSDAEMQEFLNTIS